MLPIPKERIAPQECVGVSTKPAAARPTAKVRFAVDVEEVGTRTQATERDYPKWYFEVPRVQNGIFPTDRREHQSRW